MALEKDPSIIQQQEQLTGVYLDSYSHLVHGPCTWTLNQETEQQLITYPLSPHNTISEIANPVSKEQLSLGEGSKCYSPVTSSVLLGNVYVKGCKDPLAHIL